MKNPTRKLTLGAMFAALAYLVMLVGRLPITSLDFLKYDPKDVVLVICGFTLGPSMGVVITLIVTLIELATVSSSGLIGFLMNFVSSTAYVLPAALFYRKARRLDSAIIGMVFSTLFMAALMLIWNHFVTPFHMGVPQEAVDGMLMPIFLPFNLVKGGINTALTLMLYKPLAKALRRARLLPEAEVAADTSKAVIPPKKNAVVTYAVAGVLLVLSVLGILLMKGVL